MPGYMPISLPGAPATRSAQSLAQTLIERISTGYTREEARKDGISYWPDPLPAPRSPIAPDPLVLFLSENTSTQLSESSEHVSVIPMTLREVLSRRSREQLKPSMQLPLGLIDKPELQQCDPFLADLHGIPGTTTGGPLFIAGPPHSGKTTALQTILLWLTARFLPEQLRCAVIDPYHELELYQELPHFYTNENIKLWTDGASDDRLFQFIAGFTYELNRRRDDFPYLRWNEHTLTQLWTQGLEVPQMLLIIHQYHAFLERPAALIALKKLMHSLADARNMGAYLVVTSAEIHPRCLPPDNISRFATRIGLQLPEHQYNELFGPVSLSAEHLPGRGLALLPDKSIYQVQLALPVGGANEGLRYEILSSELQRLMHLSPVVLPEQYRH